MSFALWNLTAFQVKDEKEAQVPKLSIYHITFQVKTQKENTLKFMGGGSSSIIFTSLFFDTSLSKTNLFKQSSANWRPDMHDN